MKVATLPIERLAGFLDRRRRPSALGGGPMLPSFDEHLEGVFATTLGTANQFVPSSAGSLLLDDPSHKLEEGSGSNRLVFVSCFGDQAHQLLGQEISAEHGIVGRVYRSGQPYMTRDPSLDPYFYDAIDDQIGFETQNIIAVPVSIGTAVCGVLELLNSNEEGYVPRDLDLLTVFADYISAALQNAMDARFAQELARRDDLTGLFNDRYFHRALSEQVDVALASNRDLSVIFLDLDYFKSVNDTHGHLAGSSVLREVGQLIGRLLPKTAIGARYGGDEFVVIVPGTDVGKAEKLADDLRRVIASTTFLETSHWSGSPALKLAGQVAASFGVAGLEDLGLSEIPNRQARTRLLRAADRAMYRAKEQGRNRVVRADAGDLPAGESSDSLPDGM